MSKYLGDYAAGAVVDVWLTTAAAAGGAVAPSSALEAADVVVYKNHSATQRTSAAGMTMTSPFDSIVGLHQLSIDTSDNTDAGFWAAGNDYTVVLNPDTETVDGQTVIAILAQFSIENRNIKADVTKIGGTAVTAASGIPEVKVASVAANALTAASANSDLGTEIAAAVLAAATSTPIAADIKKVNAVTVNGDGSGTPWGP